MAENPIKSKEGESELSESAMLKNLILNQRKPRAQNPRKALLATLTSGRTFGLEESIGDEPRKYSVITGLNDTTLLHVTQEDLEKVILSQFPDIFDQIQQINETFGSIHEKREKELTEAWEKKREEEITMQKRSTMQKKLKNQLSKQMAFYKNRTVSKTDQKPPLPIPPKNQKNTSSNEIFLSISNSNLKTESKSFVFQVTRLKLSDSIETESLSFYF